MSGWEASRVVVTGIAGGTCAGKSWLADAVVEALHPLKVALLRQDDYLWPLPPEVREQPLLHDFDRPEATDWERLESDLGKLRAGSAVAAPRFDPNTHDRAARPRRLSSAPVVVVEGLLVLARPEIRRLLDLKVFVDTPADVRLIRRAHRDLQQRQRSWPEVVEQYLRFVRPAHTQWVEPSRQWADLVVSGLPGDQPCLDIVVSRLRKLLHLPST
ncbi:MAG: uridine-cytidine kinase [Thermoanaerobaculaceae bacterium]|nr:uridine-cytidine kinase [Thermoanaerobaculaceae bacterium]MDI9620447.1 uridine-cytidine kinase [Acidobacteriota bacterium]NLH12759.1 uridine-cytidine kinase [Holophagae bacterium]